MTFILHCKLHMTHCTPPRLLQRLHLLLLQRPLQPLLPNLYLRLYLCLLQCLYPPLRLLPNLRQFKRRRPHQKRLPHLRPRLQQRPLQQRQHQKLLPLQRPLLLPPQIKLRLSLSRYTTVLQVLLSLPSTQAKPHPIFMRRYSQHLKKHKQPLRLRIPEKQWPGPLE